MRNPYRENDPPIPRSRVIATSGVTIHSSLGETFFAWALILMMSAGLVYGLSFLAGSR